MLFLEIAASAATIAQIWLYGRKTWLGPAFGLLSVALFWAYSVLASAWGLIPLNAFATLLHAWNLWKWTRSE
jgi:hypothetical protein